MSRLQTPKNGATARSTHDVEDEELARAEAEGMIGDRPPPPPPTARQRVAIALLRARARVREVAHACRTWLHGALHRPEHKHDGSNGHDPRHHHQHPLTNTR